MAVIYLDESLKITMDTNGRSRAERETIEAVLEELAHAWQAIDNTGQFGGLVDLDKLIEKYNDKNLEKEAKGIVQRELKFFPR